MKHTLWRVGIAVAVLGACGGKGPVDTTTAKAGPSACEKMADHLVGLMRQGAAADAPQEAADRVARTLIERCTDDGWSMDAQQCFLGLETLEQSDRCAPLLTVTQRDAADRAMKEAFPEPPGAPGPGADRAAEPTSGAPPPVTPDAPAVPALERDRKRSKAAKEPDLQPKGGAPPRTGDPCDGGE